MCSGRLAIHFILGRMLGRAHLYYGTRPKEETVLAFLGEGTVSAFRRTVSDSWTEEPFLLPEDEKAGSAFLYEGAVSASGRGDPLLLFVRCGVCQCNLSRPALAQHPNHK